SRGGWCDRRRPPPELRVGAYGGDVATRPMSEWRGLDRSRERRKGCAFGILVLRLEWWGSPDSAENPSRLDYQGLLFKFWSFSCACVIGFISLGGARGRGQPAGVRGPPPQGGAERGEASTQRAPPLGDGRGVWLPAWCLVAAFGTYFCMYGFRKPFTAAGY